MTEPEDTTREFEVWLPVVGYEGLYEVSNLGRVRSLHGRTECFRDLRLIDRSGYKYVNLSKDGKARHSSMHAVVAAAFLGPRPEGNQINHIDARPSNNTPENLEYCTPRENITHAVRLGLMATGDRNGSRTHPEKLRRGPVSCFSGQNAQDELHNRAKLDGVRVTEIRLRYREGGVRLVDLAAEYGVTFATISQLIRRRTWKHIP